MFASASFLWADAKRLARDVTGGAKSRDEPAAKDDAGSDRGGGAVGMRVDAEVGASSLTARAQKMMPDDTTQKFSDVFKAELNDIQQRFPQLGSIKTETARPTVDNNLTGLALSGGGIRSAAFSLGALQALNTCGVIEQLSYLSTVSGGGYIGTAMTISMSENGGVFPFGKTGRDVGDTVETQYLRDNSRYLMKN